jgi:hypothetical protein
MQWVEVSVEMSRAEPVASAVRFERGQAAD